MSLHTHESKVAIFLIESGRALALAQQWVQETKLVREQANALGKELGVSRVHLANDTGVVMGVYFDDRPVHPDFRKPNRNGVSYPRKGSAWAVRFAQQRPRTLTMHQVNKELGIPTSLNGTDENDHRWGRMLSSPFNPSGFLYLSKDGPFAIWTPDVDAAIRDERARGFRVEGYPDDSTFRIPGTRRILKEEWDLMVAQNKLDIARSKKVDSAMPVPAQTAP